MKSGLVVYSADTSKTAGQTADITGFGNGADALKAVLIFGLGPTSTTDAVGGGHSVSSVGMATSAAQIVCAGHNQDGVGTSNTWRSMRNDCLAQAIDTAGVDAGKLSWNTTVSDGLRVTYDTPYTTAHRYIIVGFWDVTDVELVTSALPASTGAFSVSHTGGKTYQAGIALSIIQGGSLPTGIINQDILSLGVFTASNQAVLAYRASNAASFSDSSSYIYDNEILAAVGASQTMTAAAVTFSSFASGQINLDKTLGTAVPEVAYLLFGGNTQWKVGTFSTFTDTSSTATLSLPSGVMKGGFLFGATRALSTVTTPTANGVMNMGAFSHDGSTLVQAAQALRDRDNQNTTMVGTAIEHDNVYVSMNITADTINGAGNITSVSGTDATFQMTDAEAAPSAVAYLAWGTSVTTSTKSVTIDAVLKKLDNLKTVDINAVLKKLDNVKTVSVDAVLKTLDNTKTVAADAVLKKLDNLKTVSIDAHLVVGSTTVTKSVTVDAVLKTLDNLKTTTVDAVLKKLDNTKSVSADAILKKLDNTKTTAADAVLKKENNLKATAVDAVLKRLDNTVTTSVNAVLKKLDNVKTASIDAVLKKLDNTRSVTVDAYLISGAAKTVTVDAVLKKLDNVKTVSVDAHLGQRLLKTTTVNAVLKKENVLLTCAIDAVLTQTLSKTVSVNAVLKKLDNVKTTQVDAVLKKPGIPLGVAVSAVLKKPDNVATVQISAVLKKLDAVKAVTVDALLGKQHLKTAQVDAILKKLGNTKTVTVDAHLFSGSVGITVALVELRGPSAESTLHGPGHDYTLHSGTGSSVLLL